MLDKISGLFVNHYANIKHYDITIPTSSVIVTQCNEFNNGNNLYVNIQKLDAQQISDYLVDVFVNCLINGAVVIVIPIFCNEDVIVDTDLYLCKDYNSYINDYPDVDITVAIINSVDRACEIAVDHNLELVIIGGTYVWNKPAYDDFVVCKKDNVYT